MHGNEVQGHTTDDKPISHAANQNNNAGQTGDHSHADANEKKQSVNPNPEDKFVDRTEIRSSLDDDNSSTDSYNSRDPNLLGPYNNGMSGVENSKSVLDALDESHGHVHFKAASSQQGRTSHFPPLPPGTKHKSRESDGSSPSEQLLARASWTTASFTELTNALDELTDQHHPSRTSGVQHHHGLHKKESVRMLPSLGQIHEGSLSDLQSILVKRGAPPRESILAKYLRPGVSDEGTQAGVPSWDWLMRLEQMLIHFFLMIFESSTDSSKLVMEMMPTEAGTQVEEIFQLLLKAEPEMYKELGHLVTLAEKWLIHWKGDSEERLKALDYVRLYMQGVKDKNYYNLPIQVRLHKLGAFIAGLKVMGQAGVINDPIKFPLYKQQGPVNQIRLGSPRVKPGTHFSRVVANILCGRSCEDPLPTEDVYADKLGRNVFKNTLHGHVELKNYTDKKYGQFYTRRDVFSKGRSRHRHVEGGSGDIINDEELIREDCTKNLHCWLPVYKQSYVNKLQGHGCELFAKKDFARDAKSKTCKLGTNNPDIDCMNANPAHSKKLYDWVRGPDGKVYRRVVGSYTELGVSGSLDRMVSHHGGDHHGGDHGRGGDHSGRRGPGGMKDAGGNKRFRGQGGAGAGKGRGNTPKAHSDTRLGKDAYSNKTGDGYGSGKGQKRTESGDERLKKMNKRTVDAYRVDNVSLDGSGDSGNEEEGKGAGSRHKKDPQGLTESDTEKGNRKGRGVGGVRQSQSGKKGKGKFGADYHGPSHYKSKAQLGDTRSGRISQDNYGSSSKNKGGGAGAGSGGRGTGARGGGAGGGDSSGRKGRELVDLYSKKPGQYNQNRRETYTSNNRSYRRGRYTMNEEYEGESGVFNAWSPSSDYYNYLDRDADEYGRSDDPRMLTVNQCWEKASKLMNKPHKALVIPPAENLMMYLEKKYPKSRWPRGTPFTTRDYPNGQMFVEQYANGSSRVYYPHGGLAVVISAPSPVTSHVLLVRDPADHMFFFDKALLADLNSSGKGTVFGEDGVVRAQYSALGGFKLDGLEKGQRWQWNQGGQRMIMKLNKYMSLRLSDQNRVFLNFYGNRRGFLVNVASGRDISLMNPERKRSDPVLAELKYLIRPKSVDDKYDYMHGRFNTPMLPFLDKAKHYKDLDGNVSGSMSARNLFDFDGGGDDNDYGDYFY